jgi:trehalose 6-phosphate phosphatase
MREVIQRARSSKNILLFLDYDGTLVPIKRSPELALLPPLKRDILNDLRRKFFLCIVSGRSLSEIRKYVGIKGISYIGNHGLEIFFKDKRWTHPEAVKIKPILHKSLKMIKSKTKDFRGAFVENKGLSGSIHYRLLPPKRRSQLREIVFKMTASSRRWLKVTKGKMVLEIKPKVDWDKGRGVLKVFEWLHLKEEPLLIYIGDDETDEDAFRVLGGIGLTVVVSKKGNSNARYRFRNVKEVWQFLKTLKK